jgi:dTDP-4-amino-4,6-dideoxygalactose transaminase
MTRVVGEAMASAAYINGPDVGLFEGEFAKYLDVPHAVACANGTDALHIALRALDIGPGDEVITTPFTFIATSGTISLSGATPVFVDIDLASYNIDPQAIEAAITPKTRAILPVHLYGNPANMDAILEIAAKHKLAVVEDCAQAAGATWRGRKVGGLGAIGCFSFFPSKNLGCFGDGGMITTRDEQLAARLRAICSHGSRVKYHNDVLGFNSRLDTIQAAILRVKLPHLDGWNKGRRAAAHRYTKQLEGSGVVVPVENESGHHVYHQYTIRHPRRDQIKDQLHKAGIASMIYYPIPLHLQKLYAHLSFKQGQFPRTEEAAGQVLSLPMYPELTEAQTARIAGTVLQAVSGVTTPA